MRKALKGLLFVVPIVFTVGVISLIGDHSVAAHGSQMQGGHFNGGGREGMMYNHHSNAGFIIFSLLFKIGLLATGGLLLGLANGKKGLKIAGAVVLSLGLLLLLPTIFALPFIIALAYVVYKNMKATSSSFEDFSLTDIAADQTYSTADYQQKDLLDEWEKDVRGKGGN